MKISEEIKFDFKITKIDILIGHTDWVTSIVCGHSKKENEDCSFLISGSRDKRIITWQLFEQEQNGVLGVPEKTINNAHNHFISDLALSQENRFVISSSWDQTLLVWDLSIGKVWSKCVGHLSEVYSVSLSPDNRMIISCGSDRKIKLWNSLGECKFSFQDYDSHTDWISCIRFSPLFSQTDEPLTSYFASVGWDGLLKIWEPNFKLRQSFQAHKSQINSLSISKDSKFIATGGKDKDLCIWNILDLSSPVHQFDVGSYINKIVFHPIISVVAVGTDQGIKISYANQSSDLIYTYVEAFLTKIKGEKNLYCTSLDWNALGNRLFAGFTDGIIRVFSFSFEKIDI